MAGMNWEELYSDRTAAMDGDDVKRMLKLSEEPGIISLASGLPDPDSYLIPELQEVFEKVIHDQGRMAFGYNAIPGMWAFREFLAQETSRHGRPTALQEVTVTTGGVAAMDLIAKILVNDGDTVLVGEPSYTAALHVFKSYSARIEGVALDEQGLVPELLEAKLEMLKAGGIRPKLLYLVPSFQNPSSVTIPTDRRKKIVAIAERYRVPILEDTAYRSIRFEGEAPPLLASLSPENVILVNTLSKILNPGLRIGWVVPPTAFSQMLEMAKQGQDQCSSTIGQYVALEVGRQGLLDKQISVAIETYRRKRDVALNALKRHMPGQVTWTRPEGGFYSWLTLPASVDCGKELDVIVKRDKVAYAPGSAFHHQRLAKNNIRLSYSYVSDEILEEGIARLGTAMSAVIHRNEQ